jgi:hypothetical protein
MVVKGDLAALVSFAFFYAATFAIAIWAAEMRILRSVGSGSGRRRRR